MPRQPDWTEAVEHLKQNDKRLARWIERIGPPAGRVQHQHTIFYSLMRSIVYQQLATSAATSILGKVNALFPGGLATPEAIVAASDEMLRGAGLSRNKMAAIRDLAAKTLDGTVPNARAMARLSDDEIIARCTEVKGIGRWTVEMMLVSRLGRPNVLAVDDYGLRKGFQLIYKLPDLPTKQQMLKRGEKWHPWRTVACWYLWRSLEQGKPVKPCKPTRAKS
jgi:3-methyladenine DNA glycosylase/8-oxoguanine DNA glycosylase